MRILVYKDEYPMYYVIIVNEIYGSDVESAQNQTDGLLIVGLLFEASADWAVSNFTTLHNFETKKKDLTPKSDSILNHANKCVA